MATAMVPSSTVETACPAPTAPGCSSALLKLTAGLDRSREEEERRMRALVRGLPWSMPTNLIHAALTRTPFTTFPLILSTGAYSGPPAKAAPHSGETRRGVSFAGVRKSMTTAFRIILPLSAVKKLRFRDGIGPGESLSLTIARHAAHTSFPRLQQHPPEPLL
uniref:Uncharacterized protein n=1 Tax=Mycena chlorophos TaxID=658473 RepID=A0ABQ0LDN7_MYCCL|nr:predicted protein [Mycena chlorophos]